MIAWVLHWQYSDGSVAGILRVYLDEQCAREDLELAKEIQVDPIYELVDVPVMGTTEKESD